MLERHLNHQGIIYEDMMTTFTDGTAGYALPLSVGSRELSVTTSLTANSLQRTDTGAVLHAIGIFTLHAPEEPSQR